MNTTDFTHKLIGKYVNIDRIDFPLRNLKDFFTQDDLSLIFGKNFEEDNYLIGIEKSGWFTHLIFRLNSSNKIVGYLELIKVRDVIEIHGGGINDSFIDKFARTEAWYLIIKYCFDTFKVSSIKTSCLIENINAYNLITGTGFKPIGKNEDGDCFLFNLLFEDFLSNRIFNILKRLNNKIAV